MPAGQLKLKRIAPQLVVSDVVKTAEWYRDKLGFTVLGYFGDPPVYAIVERDDVEIHFGRADKGAQAQLNERVREGSGNDFYIWVSDIDVLHEELLGRGVSVVEGPVKRIYESTEVVIRDCNGFQLVFAV
jgi:catechol 2,3-dioxygenase-like lactoylglutathione lyase family enzyme